MKFDIYFKQPKIINGKGRYCIMVFDVINCFTKNGYIYLVSLKDYKRFKNSEILYIDMVV